MAQLPASQLLAAGRQYLQSGHYARGISSLKQVLEAEPDSFQAHSLLGIAYRQSANPQAAMPHFLRALSVSPAWAEGHVLLGNMLAEQGNYQDAVKAFENAVRLNPQNADALNNLGTVLKSIGQAEQAAAALRSALMLRPDSPEIHYNLATALLEMGQTDLALLEFERAIALQPAAAHLYQGLGNALLAAGRAAESVDCFRHALKIDPLQDRIHSSLLMAMHYTDAVCENPPALLEAHVAFEKIHITSPIAPRSHVPDPTPDRRLRIGYFSSDFRRHSVAFFIEPIFLHHDKARFEVICYADVANPDAITARLIQMVSLWRNVHGQTDAQIAGQINSDRIDILIDLAGHTGGGRPRLFAQKPAPIQVSYLGYPDTTGLSSIDYRLTDRIADPPGGADRFYVEKLVRLDPVFLCYQPPIDAPDGGFPPATRNGFVTFGSFNNLAKITSSTIALWSNLIQAVPRSRLLLKARGLQNPAIANPLADRFSALGIDRNRLLLQGHTAELSEHLACYNQVDIALDTFAYNGTTTTCEALWMGTPVLTLFGLLHCARVGATLLSCIGHPEWIARNPDEFVYAGVSLSADVGKLQIIRSRLRDEMRSSPITNAAGFTHEYEIALRHMWQELQRKTVDSGVSTGL